MASKTTKVAVPQQDGEITFRVYRDYAHPEKVYEVKDGHVEVPNEDLDEFLTYIPGAEKPGDKAEDKTTKDGK
jgi:hypothetical protein